MSDASIHERLDQLRFFQTPDHECNYLHDQVASTIFVDPAAPLNAKIYSQLALIGFRRSGRYLYKPRCPQCSACIPIRIPVDDFKPNRSQRRIMKKNADIKAEMMDSRFNDEHYALYEKYLKSRHPEGGMDDTTPEKYESFLCCQWLDTRFVEFRVDGQLLGVAVTDVMTEALSGLYTFFDPEMASRSLGTYAILWQIQAARDLQMKWVYLGYWINECGKMNYKTRFRPYEIYESGQWVQMTEHHVR